VDLAELRAGVADVSITYRRQTFSVGYRPEAVDEDDLALFEAFGEHRGVELLRSTVTPLVRMLCRWSITNDGAPLEITEDSIKRLPPRMRMAILEAVMRDFFDSGNASAYDAGSPEAAASEEAAPSTPDSSSTRNGQASLPGTSPASVIPAAG
jgi:hypothetical protein